MVVGVFRGVKLILEGVVKVGGRGGFFGGSGVGVFCLVNILLGFIVGRFWILSWILKVVLRFCLVNLFGKYYLRFYVFFRSYVEGVSVFFRGVIVIFRGI